MSPPTAAARVLDIDNFHGSVQVNHNLLKDGLRRAEGSIEQAIGGIGGDKRTGLEGTARKAAEKPRRAPGKAAQAMARSR